MKGPIGNLSQKVVVKPDVRQVSVIGKGGVGEKRKAVVVEINRLQFIEPTKNVCPVGVGAW